MKNVIFMIGLMGSGKTTVGTILAQKMGAAFLDTDALIEEREGMKISEIFEKFGESYFGDLETALLEELSRNRRVIRVGRMDEVGRMNRDCRMIRRVEPSKLSSPSAVGCRCGRKTGI